MRVTLRASFLFLLLGVINCMCQIESWDVLYLVTHYSGCAGQDEAMDLTKADYLPWRGRPSFTQLKAWSEHRGWPSLGSKRDLLPDWNRNISSALGFQPAGFQSGTYTTGLHLTLGSGLHAWPGATPAALLGPQLAHCRPWTVSLLNCVSQCLIINFFP